MGVKKQIEFLNISGDKFVEYTARLSEIIELTDVIGLGGSLTNDGGFGLLSKMGLDFFAGKEIIN